MAIVDAVADPQRHPRGRRGLPASIWYSKEGQEIAARNSYRPRDPEVAGEYGSSFPKLELFTINEVFGGWAKAQKEHFAEGGCSTRSTRTES